MNPTALTSAHPVHPPITAINHGPAYRPFFTHSGEVLEAIACEVRASADDLRCGRREQIGARRSAVEIKAVSAEDAQ